ncbi:hypothetical protein RUM43_003540 [Polyplax serrata]|uniref:Gamma-tubulin complex component n=1 Tax=Polyplax serrata TaxID=468196 RepID=A0AAN8S5L4_POLSC
MSLPPQDVLDGIDELIAEITGLQESDENFEICQRYCLSHVIHHTYPFVNRTTIKNLFNSYVSRFYGHGYFKVSEALQQQVKNFLSNTSLFEKNPQYDIEWCLLSLVSALSTNLTSVKDVPELLPTDDEETEAEEIDWLEYLTSDLPIPEYSEDSNNESDTLSTENGEEKEEGTPSNGTTNKNNKEENTIYGEHNVKLCDTTNQNNYQSCEILSEEQQRTTSKDEIESHLRIKRLNDLLQDRKSIGDIEHDYRTRGNICEKFDKLLSSVGFVKKSQVVSELELMEYILYQFQTGEKILSRKGLVHPALISVTHKTLGNYLDSLQPYFQIIRCFKDFDTEIMAVKYPDLNLDPDSAQSPQQTKRQNIPNVLYVYSVMLRRALKPFFDEILTISDNLCSYTLIKMHQKIQSHFFELTSLFYVHGMATKNWKRDANWICSIRILSVLYNAIMSATTVKMSFLYLNLFLHCFQVYLDTIDSWISLLNLNDPADEFIVAKSQKPANSSSFCTELQIRPYKKEMEMAEIKDVPILDFIAEESPFRLRLSSEKKKRSIFTMSNMTVMLSRDTGMGDSSIIGGLMEELEDKKKSDESKSARGEENEKEANQCNDHCLELMHSTIQNSFFKQAFEDVGIEYQRKRLEALKASECHEGDLELEVIKQPSKQKFAVYPYQKIILESCRQIIGKRVSSACELVKEIVIEECDLKGHLSVIRSVMLFNDSYLIQPFILTFFSQPIVWDSSYSLTVHLKECLENRYKEFLPLLSVSVTKDFSAVQKNVLQAIDAMTINYEASLFIVIVQWPLTLIFTPDAMMKYNKVFRLAMKLKWAHWNLSNLHFQKESSVTTPLLRSTHHRLQLLRFWFLSTLGLINNYFVAQMNSTDLNLDMCGDLRLFIKEHSQFVDNIYGICRLGDKSPDVWSVIFRTLIPLCIDLEKHWREGSVVPDTKLMSMETVFANCQVQIARMLSSQERK